MSLHESQNFLARIYTDENLRLAFLSAPETVGKANDLTDREIKEIIDIFPDEISRFAESLVWKRLRAVEKLLPLTRRYLSSEFEAHFRRFAPTFNSQSVKKHLDDAIKFGNYLQKSKDVSKLARNAAKYECAKLEFYALNKNVVVRSFDFDVQSGAKRRHLKIWLRIGKREFVF